ncbi:endonuclease III [Candidatus Peregrinibacteria bacterium HGW-Peregrinibacteria-1]|jgi:endonuclease-3|nr:MAG: endonuclease III [Candidatus Peregrinibacteria bacterium HGW-Peregrinibacteria-1]
MKRAPVGETIERLRGEYPDARIALNYNGVWQLMVAVILSAQCTDERVNMVTPVLFGKYPTAESTASCQVEDLEQIIYSTGFYRSKAKNIRLAAIRVMEEFGGEVPDSMEELLTIPGVARKTANVVLFSGFGKSEGIVVDTHVARISGRLKWVSEDMSVKKKAVAIEKKLMKIIPKSEWGKVPHLMILHGRKTCVARKPRCGACVLKDICPSSNSLNE